ncbi:MAG: EAL domain-containing protein [Oscillospiraceae bacterium]|nr:EAL domain-containing protein [Oscillospiraceae bacterium]
MYYNISYELCALPFLFIMIVYYFTKTNITNLCGRIFAGFMALSVCTILTDILTAYTISYSASVPLWLNMWLNAFCYFFQTLQVIWFFVYVVVFTENWKREHLKRLCIYLLPGVISLICVLVTPFTKLGFFFDADMKYHHGPLFAWLYVMCATYMIGALVLVFRSRKNIAAIQFWTIYSFVILMAIALVIQLFFPAYLLSGAAVTLSVFMMYLTMQNPDEYIDKLTGVYRRSALLLTLEKYYNQKKECFLVIIDLNNFKIVNNVFGLKAGDALMAQIADYLNDICTQKTVFRLNGDRFIITTLSETLCDSLCVQIQNRFNASWRIAHTDINLHASVCRLPVSRYAGNLEDAMKLQESAIYYLKSRKKGNFLNVNQTTAAAINRRNIIETELRAMLGAKALEVYFQPIYSSVKECVTGAEVLLRMPQTSIGYVSPEEFIPIAEQIGLINSIGTFVLEKTCEFIAENQLWNYNIDVIHINLSTVQCMEIKLSERIVDILTQYKVPPGLINFEITETAVIASANQLRKTMFELQKCGITFSMDDYGNGYASSSTMIEFPFNTIKIDKSLLWNCETSEKAKILYTNTVNMIKQMKMTVVAEGAETVEQINLLQKMGVDYIQGF